MTLNLMTYFCALILFVVIDMIWLMGPGRPFYVAEIGNLLRANPVMPAAIAFYFIYAAGLCYFGISHGLGTESVMQAAIAGAIFGFMAYGTYDLTNLAVMKDFTTKIAMIDLAWGTFLSGIVAALTAKIVLTFS